jgi:hypothetical protein
MKDKLGVCPHCGGDACYETEVIDGFTTYQCYGCGYTTTTMMKEGEKFYEEQMHSLPELHKDLAFTDKENKVWIPTTVNLPSKGMVFADGKSTDNWKWSAVKAVPVKEEEKTKYPIPNSKGKYYEWRMDMTTLEKFDQGDFMEALDCIGMFEKVENEN